MRKKIILFMLSIHISFGVYIFADVTIYSDEPLKNSIIMDRAEWLVDFTYFNNYLIENYDKLEKDEMDVIREHTFLLIDSIVKDVCSEKRLEYEASEKNVLKILYNWGSRLGLYGCDSVAEYFHVNNIETIRSEEINDAFRIQFNYPYFNLSSNEGNWNILFPFYFMISTVTRFNSNYGAVTEAVKLSTLFSEHTVDNGNSQGTILIIFSYTDEYEKVKNYWINTFGLTGENRTNDEIIENSESYYGYDNSNNINKELVFLDSDNGVLMISFTGIDGTYQNNRIHFVNFMNNIEY